MKKSMTIYILLFLLMGLTVSVSGQALTSPTVNEWQGVPDDIKDKNFYKRYEWFYRTRLDETGEFPKAFIDGQKSNELSKIQTIIQKGNKLQTTSDLWQNIGPKAIDMTSATYVDEFGVTHPFMQQWGKVSGRIRGLAVHPTDPNTVYIGAAAGGIWKTVNGGTNWTDMSGDLNLLTFGAIAIDPGNTNVIYAGTGEIMWDFNNTTFEGDGLYKSTDGGISWIKITSGFGTQTQFSDIVVSPHNSNIILASIGSGNWNNQNPTNEGVWRSSDAGLTWTRVINQGDAFDIAFHPTNTSIAYAATGGQNASGGFFISNDAGATWAQSNTGLPSSTAIGRMQFSVSPSSPSIIFSLIYNSAALAGGYKTAAFKSLNGGANWSQISSGVHISGTYDGVTISDQGWYDLCLDVSPTNSDNVFFGNVEISKTTNGSAISYVRKTPKIFTNPGAWDGFTHTDIHKISYAPSNSSIIYVACDGGIYKSVDGGLTFANVNNNINTIQFYRIASDKNNVSKLFGGAQDNGNFSTSDKGATDWVFETSGDGMECFVDYSNSNNIFMSTQVGSLLRSINGGVNVVKC